MEDTTFQPTVLDKPPKRSKFVFFFIISIFIIIAVFGGWRFLTSRNEESEEATVTPTPTEYQLPTEAPESLTPEATKAAKPTSKPTPTVTPKPSVSPVVQTASVERSNLTVEVQNGSGVVGAAKKAADALKELGYVISSTGNADNYEYSNVIIKVKNSKSSFLTLLKKDLESTYTIGTSSADLTATSSADALVIVGK